MFWEDFYWSSFGHVLLSEPITMARGIALIGQAQVMGTPLGSGGSLLVHSTDSGEGVVPPGKTGVQLLEESQRDAG